MANPMEALKSLQKAIENGFEVNQCELDLSLSMVVDRPNDNLRFSYVKIEDGIVKALSIFVNVEPIEGIACFNIGYAVPKMYRNRGLATEIVEKGIAELRNGLGRSGVKKFYVEAIIDIENLGSQRVAHKVISTDRHEIVDSRSGKNSYYYTRLIEIN